MKTCSKCKIEKPLDEFHKYSRAKDGRQYICKECNNGQRKDYYKTAHGRSVDIANGKRSKHRLREKALEALSSRPCADCGESDPVVLEFDHRDPEMKLFDISVAVCKGYAWDRIAAEIDKCDVRCANCHRRRTAVQFGWIKGR